MSHTYLWQRTLIALLLLSLAFVGFNGPHASPVAAQSSDLVITGVIDGPLSGGVPKAIELYVINDIPDLSAYGVGSANNGGGSDGQEFTLSGSATAGDSIYIASESTGFESFFGFAPDFITSAANINGDDAIELFQNGTVVDVFGDINVDGTGQPWEHTDGWAKRVDGTGPDGSTFVLSNWTFSGPDALDGETSNDTAATPFPLNGTSNQPGSALLISGVIDGPLSGGVPKAVELYALADIADLSAYGIGSANNGGGTDGQEFTLSGSAAAGDYLYVASESPGFESFFGFAPDFISNAANINGDDAIELFFNGEVVDLFGEIDVDGTGQPWEHTDGWAKRVNGTGPDGSTFVLGNWTFSGPDALDGETSNDTAATPFPLDNGPDQTGNNLLISGVIDGPLSGGVPKAVELYALGDIADLSAYGIGSANNGGGSDGQEFTLSGSATAGDYIYVASESPGFQSFFGFVPNFTSSAANINGDDAIELFFNGEVVDVFGEINVDGTGQPWEHTDGWAYRNSGTGPDGSTFVLGNWRFSGTDALDGESANSTAATPFPLGSYGGGSQPTPTPVPTPVPTSTPVAQGCGTAATFIHDIQGSGSDNLLDGTVVSVEGIVIADYQTTNALSGFFVQEEDADADGNPATSEGIFIYEDAASPILDVNVGDRVRVTGTVDENFGVTSLDLPSIELCASGNPLPAPVSLQLPIPGFNATNTSDATTQINAYLEPFEGMLVQYPQSLQAVEYFELSRFGQILLASERLRQYTDQSAPTAAGYQQHLADIASKSIILDDDNNIQNAALVDDGTADDEPVFYPEPGGFSTSNYFRGGDTIANLTGVLDFAFSEWRVRPVAEQYDYQFSSANSRDAAPAAVGGSLKVASFNVLNYFTTVDNTASDDSGPCAPSGTQDCRGADSEAERVRQLDKIVAALNAMDADIVGLIELENIAAANPAGDGIDPVLQSIVAALNAVNADTYDFIDTGSIGTDAIRVAFIFKTSTVAPTGAFAVLDSSVDPTFVDTRNRPVLAQTFTEFATGGKLTVAVNHLKSKGSGCGSGDDDTTTGQGNCNGTRTAAAAALASWLASDPTGSGDADALIIGDLNAYRNEDPIVALENAGFTDLIDQFNGASAYGYLFDGQVGYLDHALANASLLPQVTGVTEWHINADEVNLLDYNDQTLDSGEASFEEKPEPNALFEANAFRSSDHDPVIVGLNLTVPVQDVDANDLLDLTQVNQIYNGTPQPNAPAGTFTIAATFQNKATSPELFNLYYQVAVLTNGNLLLNADGGPGGVGSTVSIPASSLGGDGVLSPGESFYVEFVIGLQSLNSFDFIVDAYGQTSGVAAASLSPVASHFFGTIVVEDAIEDVVEDVTEESPQTNFTNLFLPLVTNQ